MINLVLSEIDYANSNDINAILLEISNNTKSELFGKIENKDIFILAYKFIIKQIDFTDLSVAVEYIRNDLLIDSQLIEEFFKIYQGNISSFINTFYTNYNFEDNYFHGLEFESVNGDIFIDEDQYWSVVDNVVDDIQHVENLLKLDFHITKDDIAELVPFDELNDKLQNNLESPYTQTDKIDKASTKIIEELFT